MSDNTIDMASVTYGRAECNDERDGNKDKQVLVGTYLGHHLFHHSHKFLTAHHKCVSLA